MKNNEGEMVMFTCYLTEAQHEWLRRESFETRTPMAEILRQLLMQAMAENDEPQK